MAARVFPPEAGYESYAEQWFVDALVEQLPDEAVVFRNQRFTDWREDREADAIVAWPGVGVAVIEIKGGSVSLRDGQWWQTGGKSKAIDPVGQARKCKYLLHAYLSSTRGGRAASCGRRTSSPCPRRSCRRTSPRPTRPAGWSSTRTRRRTRRAGSSGPCGRSEGQPPPPGVEDVELLVDCLAGRAIPQADLVADAGRAGDRLRAAHQAAGEGARPARPRSARRDPRRSGVGQDLARRREGPPAGRGRQAGRAHVLLARPGRVPHPPRRDAAREPATGLRRHLPQPRHRLGRAARQRRRQRVLGGVPARRDGVARRRRCRSGSASTPSSSTRRRTSPRAGGPRSWRRCATRTAGASTCSPTRGSGSSPGRAGRRSTWSRST